jgi:two-component sensor histidine kinase
MPIPSMKMNVNILLLSIFILNNGYNQQPPIEKIDSLIILSDQLRFTSPDSCLALVKKAHYYSLLVNDSSLIVKSGIKLARAQNDIGLYQKGLKTVSKIQNYCIGQKDSLVNIAEIHYTKGFSFLEMAQYDESKKEFFDALDCFFKLNDSSGISACYLSIGNIESNKKKLNEALNYYQKSLNYTDDNINKAYVSTNMGIIYAEKKDYLKAKHNFQNTIKIYEGLNFTNELAISYYDLGYLEYSFNHYTSAIEYYKSSLKIAQTDNNAINMMWAYDGLSKVYKAQNKFKDALIYSENFHKINDSLNNIQKDEELKNIEINLEKEKQSLIIENQIKEIEEANIREELYKERINKSQLKNRLLGLGLFIICVLGGIGYVIYRKVKKQNSLLKEQKKIINKSLLEKEILLKEIHHRVKNNLQIISSLLNLQSNRIDNEEIQSLLNESKDRIQAIALVHDKLYKSNDFTSINFKEYLLEILNQQKNIYLQPTKKMEIITDCEAIKLKLDIAVPLGLIASEIITNAFKHAFNDVLNPILNIKLNQIDNNKVKLTINDNGKGLPFDFDINNPNTLGMELITALSEQINSSIYFKNYNGTQFTVIFSIL